MTRQLVLLATGMCLAAGAAHAATNVNTAPVYGTSALASIACYFSNRSAATVTVTGTAIAPDNGGGGLALSSDSCTGASLAAGQGCTFTAALTNPFGAYFCHAAVPVAASTGLRLTLENLAADGSVINTEDGR